MAFWVLLIVAAAAAWFIARPLLSGPGSGTGRERSERGRLRDLIAAKEATYAALKEIEFDRLTHKLDEDDYRVLQARYRAQAVRLLKEIDALEAASSPARERRSAKNRKAARA